MQEDTYGHTPYQKAIIRGDVYGISFDEARASRKKIRLGYIGAGGVVQSKHLPAIQRLRTLWEPVEVCAFVTPDEQQAGKVQRLYGGHWYGRHEELLAEEELDGVVVCSPDSLHGEHSLACLERGLPVLVEKPITRSLAEAKRMCGLAEEKKVPLMTVSNKRFSPPYSRARKMIEQGALANPAMYVGKFSLGYDYVDLFEAGTIHIFDMTRYLMGDVSSLRCKGTNKYRRSKRSYPVDNAICTFEFNSGAVGAVYTSATALSFKPWERVEVYADHAWLEVDDQYRLTIHDDERGPSKYWEPAFPNTLLFDEEFGGFMGLIENFIQAIRGVEKPLVTGWDGYRAYELAAASHLSLARHGAELSLPLDAEEADQEVDAWLKASGWPGNSI
jgi:predicted dehydrogenase